MKETDPLISVLIGTRNRPKILARCIQSVQSQEYENYEICILDNSMRINSCDYIKNEFDNDRVSCKHISESLGVAGSRNLLMEQASGDIFVIIDDDAYFENDNALHQIVKNFEPDIGIQSFKIINHPAESTEEILAPLPKSEESNQDLNKSFTSSYYYGGGHAIKKEVIEQCGMYESRLIYGMEELDLSYRAINGGWKIKYIPSVIVHHYPEQSEIDKDSSEHSELYYSVGNRIYFAVRYLPFPYILTYLCVWLGYLLIESIHNRIITEYLLGIRRGIQLARISDRESMSNKAISYLRNNYGRLWY